MKSTQLQTVPTDLTTLFDSIMDDPETYREVTEGVDDRIKKRIAVVKVRRKKDTVKLDTMREVVKMLGFEEVQQSMWRKKLRAKSK